MGITQLSKQLGRNLEHELAHLFIILGDNQLPEEAHTPGHISSIKGGIDASGLGGDTLNALPNSTATEARHVNSRH